MSISSFFQVVIVKNRIHHCRTSGIFMRLAASGLIAGKNSHEMLPTVVRFCQISCQGKPRMVIPVVHPNLWRKWREVRRRRGNSDL